MLGNKKESRGIFGSKRARTVEPEAYYRGIFGHRHSLESGGCLMIKFEQLPEYGI